MKEEDLVQHYPRLWHMAHGGSWPSIRANGLLSTTALLDLYSIVGAQREKIEGQRRPDLSTLVAAGLPPAVIRDQKPMSDGALRKCLGDGLTPEDWYRLLNGRAFFWLSHRRLWRLLRARAYRDSLQTVLTLDTGSLVAAHRGQVQLSPINSGATIFNPQPRGATTFRSINEYPFEEMKRRRGASEAVVELVVVGGVPDVLEHVLSVHDVFEGNAEIVWAREGTPALREL